LGKVIDIGCGDDPVTPRAELFDVQHGDANYISRIRDKESYDCVYSSHSLEHMEDVEHALKEWWLLVKPGGHMVLVVPDEDLYEQGFWPSCFNGDHKYTFTTKMKCNPSPVSKRLPDLLNQLEGCELIDIRVQDHEYKKFLQVRRATPFGRNLLEQYRRLCRKLDGTAPLEGTFLAIARYAFNMLGMPIDQTQGEALAQIQAVVRKRSGGNAC
jgi:predicted SAM-dependent methyltransferase